MTTPRKQQMRKKIKNAAFSLFVRYGIKKVSIAEIAENASISQVSVYNNFKNKEALILETLEDFLETKAVEFDELIEEKIPFTEKLQKVMKKKQELNKDGSWSFIQEAVNSDEKVEGLFKKHQKNKIQKNIEKMIKKGREENFIRENISDEAINLYFEMLQDFFMREKDIKKYQKQSKIIEEIFEIFWFGIAKKKL